MTVRKLYQELSQLAKGPFSNLEEQYEKFMSKAVELDEALQAADLDGYKNPKSASFAEFIQFFNQIYMTHPDINIQTLAAGRIASRYSSTTPKSGLPLTDNPGLNKKAHPHLKKIEEWYVKAITHGRGEVNSRIIFQLKNGLVDYLSKLYGRRKLMLQAAGCLAYWVSAMTDSAHNDEYALVEAVSQLTALIQELPKDVTLETPEVQALLAALGKAMLLMSQLPDRSYIEIVLLENAHSNPRDIEARTLATVGLFLAKTPSKPGKGPDFKQAAKWLKTCLDIGKTQENEGIGAGYAARSNFNFGDIFEKNPDVVESMKALDKNASILNAYQLTPKAQKFVKYVHEQVEKQYKYNY